jgi:hypothetical protein
MAARADLLLAYAQRRAADDEDSCEQIADSVAELDDQLRSLGVRGRLAPLEPAPKAGQALQPASPRRPQPAPAAHRTPHPGANLRRPLPAVDVCDADAALLRQSRRPRRRHPPRQLRLPARRQRCHPLSGVGGSVLAKHPPLCRVGGCSTSAPSNPKNAGAPHFHAAIRGTIPRAELRAITVATYHQVWWPPHDQLVYTQQRPPIWDTRARPSPIPTPGYRCRPSSSTRPSRRLNGCCWPRHVAATAPAGQSRSPWAFGKKSLGSAMAGCRSDYGYGAGAAGFATPNLAARLCRSVPMWPALPQNDALQAGVSPAPARLSGAVSARLHRSCPLVSPAQTRRPGPR